MMTAFAAQVLGVGVAAVVPVVGVVEVAEFGGSVAAGEFAGFRPDPDVGVQVGGRAVFGAPDGEQLAGVGVDAQPGPGRAGVGGDGGGLGQVVRGLTHPGGHQRIRLTRVLVREMGERTGEALYSSIAPASSAARVTGIRVVRSSARAKRVPMNVSCWVSSNATSATAEVREVLRCSNSA